MPMRGTERAGNLNACVAKLPVSMNRLSKAILGGQE
jgi:hypothetical protein